MENAGRAETVEGAVELVYLPTPEDLLAGMRVRMRTSAQGRRVRWTIPIMGFVVCLFAAVNWSHGQGLGDRGVYVPLTAGITMALARFYANPLAARKIHKSIVAKQGEYRAVVDETGVTISHGEGAQTVAWSAQPQYAETADHFVTVSADKLGAGLTVLPKRGLREPADVDRLRALLDRNLRRVGK